MANKTGLRSVVVGGVSALAVVVALVVFVGVDDLLRRLAAVSPATLLLLAGLAAAWLTCWGVSLYVVLRTLGWHGSLPRAVALYTSVNFANSVVPFGHAGAGPVAALLVTRGADTDYDTSLAAVACVDALNVVPSGVFVLGGVGVLAGTAALDPMVGGAAVLGVILLAVALAAGVAVYRNHRGATESVLAILTWVSDRLARILPGVPPLADRIDSLGSHVEGFFESVGRLSSDRAAVAAVLALSTLGWGALTTALWVATDAVGPGISIAVAALTVPLSMLAIVLPLPGGAGGVEAGIVLLLVSAGGLTPAGAAAAALLYRATVWALPVLVGGAVTVVMQTRP